MRLNLERRGAETNINFWFGTGIHFAMEDYFGYNKFGDPIKAFQAYYAAFKPEDRPEAADAHYDLGKGMLEYFKEWYPRHNADYHFQTVWLTEKNEMVPPGTEGARPLLEESFLLDLGIRVWVDSITGDIVPTEKVTPRERYTESGELDEGNHAKLADGSICLLGSYQTITEPEGVWDEAKAEYREAVEIPIGYHGTLDRVVVDKYGRWWIMDWKTAKSADTNKLDTDDQISAYMWA